MTIPMMMLAIEAAEEEEEFAEEEDQEMMGLQATDLKEVHHQTSEEDLDL